MNIPILVPTHTYEIPLPPLSSLRPLQCLSVPPRHQEKNSGCRNKGFYIRILLSPPSHGMPSEKHNCFFGSISFFH